VNGAVITALNEADTIGGLVAEILRNGLAVIVVDDGSTDGTGDEAAKAGATVITHDTPQGIAPSLMDAWRMAYSFGWTRIIQIDAGGSHDPAQIDRLLTSGTDVTIGSRFLPSSEYIGRGWRKHASNLAAVLLNWAAHQHIHDWTSGYRVFSRKAIEVLLSGNYMTTMHTWQIETLHLALKCGLSVSEFPITYRAGQSTFKLKTVDDFIKVFLWVLNT